MGLLEPRCAQEDEQVTPRLPETPRECARSASRSGSRRIEVKELAGVGVLEDKSPAPGIDVRHAAPPTLLLRSARSLSANALEMPRLLS